jgi:ribosomal protein L11 methyltransferase
VPSRRCTFRVPAERQDELIAELWALGTLGVHFRESDGVEVVDAYFPPASSDAAAAAAAAACGAVVLQVAEVADEDWLAAYRARARSFRVGAFLLAPGEPEPGEAEPVEAEAAEPEGGAILLRVPARNAFGTGSHESTRLVLEELPRLALAGATVLDVGTGSGILALAALRLGARRAVACDLDTASVVTARDNARLNGLAPALFAGPAAAVGGDFDRVLVNILPERWLPGAAAVVRRLAARGTLLVSGLLAEQRADVLEPLTALGLEPRGERRDGDWLALLLGRR